jgi:hypothetical protein
MKYIHKINNEINDNCYNLLIRGEAFRIGGQSKRRTNGSIDEQKIAFESIKKNIIHPLKEKYSKINIYVDIVVLSKEKQELIKKWFSELKDIKIIHIHKYVLETQIKTLEQSLMLIKNNYPILIIRIDTVFKVKIPFNKMSNTYFYVPFHGKFGPRINDIMIQIPKKSLFIFKKALKYHKIDLHYVYESLINLKIPKDKLKFIINKRYDANSAKEWNPIYYLIGRPIAKK